MLHETSSFYIFESEVDTVLLENVIIVLIGSFCFKANLLF